MCDLFQFWVWTLLLPREHLFHRLDHGEHPHMDLPHERILRDIAKIQRNVVLGVACKRTMLGIARWSLHGIYTGILQ